MTTCDGAAIAGQVLGADVLSVLLGRSLGGLLLLVRLRLRSRPPLASVVADPTVSCCGRLAAPRVQSNRTDAPRDSYRPPDWLPAAVVRRGTVDHGRAGGLPLSHLAVCVCVHACVRACVRTCVRACDSTGRRRAPIRARVAWPISRCRQTL